MCTKSRRAKRWNACGLDSRERVNKVTTMEIKKAQMVRWLKGYSEDMFISLLARETAKAILSEMKRLRRIERAARKWSVFKLSPGDFMDVLYAPKRKAEAEDRAKWAHLTPEELERRRAQVESLLKVKQP